MHDNEPETEHELIEAIDHDLARSHAVLTAERARLAALDAEQASQRHHPNTVAYTHGAFPLLRGMGLGHILPHAGFYLLAHGEAIARLAEAQAATGDECLIMALTLVCESDPLLDIAGLAWLDSHHLLRNGGLDPFWAKRPKLGLGQPAKLHGLTIADADAHRALYTFAPSDLRRRFGAVADSDADTFGDLLPRVIDADRASLGAIGAAASENDAAERYWAKCASFAGHQRATGDRRWRWKPPLSRQGHHAVTIARLNDVPVPAERTRGHAATWLDHHGANPRFRKD